MKTYFFQAPGISGECTSYYAKWTFVKSFGCYSFKYSGCGGNQNNFATKKDCDQMCNKAQTNTGEIK